MPIIHHPRKPPSVILLLFVLLLFRVIESPAIEVVDDAGRKIFLEHPAKNIISLAPHITELIFSAGAGDKISAIDDYSDYPEETKSITRIGDANHLDIEVILSLQPDLIVAWGNGQSHNQFIQQLIHLKQTVYISSPVDLDDIPRTIENLGKLAGTYPVAKQRSQEFRNTLKSIIDEYSKRSLVTVFYEIWHQPLFTINGQHVISKVIRICGGENIFTDLLILSPEVSIESVIAADPDVIIAGGDGKRRPRWLDNWLQWPTLMAVRNNHLDYIEPDLMQRHTFRILQGARILCEQLQRAR